jgi:hypothetical protein
LKALQDDKRLIFSSAAHGLQPKQAEEERAA